MPRRDNRKAAAKLAGELLGIIEGALRDKLAESPESVDEGMFWMASHRGAAGRGGIEPPPVVRGGVIPMNDKASQEFERRVMIHGKHRGKPISRVPKRYLGWLVTDGSCFNRELCRYVESDRFRDRDRPRERAMREGKR